MRGMPLLLVLLGAIAVSGCETKSEWTDWKDITAEQSMVRIVWPPEAKPVNIKRRARSERYKYIEQEHWIWRSGAAWVTKLPNGMYSRIRIHDAGSLQKRALSGWDHLKNIALRVEEGDVEMGANDVGKYFYAVSDRNTAAQVCFVFYQALPLDVVGNYQEVPGASGGEITAFDCQPVRTVSIERMKALMVSFVENIDMQ